MMVTLTPAPAVSRTVAPGGVTLQARGLTKAFGVGDARTVALDDATLELFAGELVLLMGPSGSGKSTLLAVLSALLHPDAGSVTALGEDLWSLDDSALERFRLAHCSYIFQGYNLFPALTAREQCEIVLRWGERSTRAAARKRTDHVLATLGMTAKANLRPAQLSGGEKQRVAIARALVKDPAFVFADEPTAALDWENGHQVIELLRDSAHGRGATVLVVTHDHRLVPYADRVFSMADGRLTPGVEHDAPAARGPRLQLRDPAA